MATTDVTVKDIIVALKYCISDDGIFCDMCAYQQFGPGCSKRLLVDASNELKNFYEPKVAD